MLQTNQEFSTEVKELNANFLIPANCKLHNTFHVFLQLPDAYIAPNT